MIKFKYFEGSKNDMIDLIHGVCVCSICNSKNEMCFDISYAITKYFTDEEKIGKVGCVKCLRKGEFKFWHATEYGMLNENGLSKVYNHNINNPPSIEPDKLTELKRTPQIMTWQQELWLTHCDDFMIYKGTWEPIDFYENSKNENGRDLFLEMTDEDFNHLWDDSLEKGESKLTEWHATYYVFECSHCGKKRGNWDCD